jgi:putative membrane protein insertion efficiency factor
VASGRCGGGCRSQVCLIETGCCAVQVLGRGPRSAFLAPSLVRRSVRGAGPRRGADRVQDRLLRVALEAITIYQHEIGPSLPLCCRFTPGCSTYAATALQELGLRRGGWLAARRLLRCHPWAAGGHDPVPLSLPRAA